MTAAYLKGAAGRQHRPDRTEGLAPATPLLRRFNANPESMGFCNTANAPEAPRGMPVDTPRLRWKVLALLNRW